MAVIVVMVLCLVFVDLHRSVSGQSSCKCSFLELNCRGQNLTSLHETLQNHLNCEGASRTIDVSKNKLKELHFPKEFMQRNRNADILADDNHLTSLNGLEDWTGIDLSIKGNNFSSVNVSPWKNHLKALDISLNHLTILDLSFMEILTSVLASNNSLSDLILPSERCSLRRLDLHSNKLSLLPTEIHKCRNLTELYVNHNSLSLLDPSLMEILIGLDASNNSLSHLILPSERCLLKKLDLGYNKLPVLPMDLRNCVNLTELSITNNNLVELDLSEMFRLVNVAAARNAMKTLILPQEFCSIVRLTLTSNKLTSVPQGLFWCSRLEHIELDDNALKEFPDCLLKLLKHRPDAPRRNIFVNVRRNPLTLLEISTFRDFIQQQGLFMHLFDEDFFTIKERDCECSEMKFEHFAPVVYCATIMCDKGENLWQHL